MKSVSDFLARIQQEGHLHYVRKRSGDLVPFDPDRITTAIRKALQVTREKPLEQAEQITLIVLSRLNGQIVHLEDIQDVVEDTLMDMGLRSTAKRYILYREQRSEIRKLNFLWQYSQDIIDDYLQLKDWRVRENSNTSYSLQGLNAHIASKITAEYWLTKIFPEEAAKAHREGYLHIHDLGSLSTYCVGWDLEQLLLEGFGGVPGKVESRPPKHFRTALGQLVNFFFTMQGEAAGAQAVSNFDTLLAPFVAYDNLSYSDIKQAMQEFIFNVNVPTRTGFQTPFVNITFDCQIPEYLKNQATIVGGELQSTTYGEFEKEVYLINKAFCEIMLEGDARNRPFTFPIPTLNLTPQMNWYSPDHLYWWKLTAKYGSPYFSNFINSDMKVEDARSMCCRLRLDNRQVRSKLERAQNDIIPDQPRRGGIFSANPLTGSIGVITINLPRLAFETRNIDYFFEKLDYYMQIAANALEVKRKLLENLTEKGLYPYTMHYLRDIKKRTGKYWDNHFSTIGIIGMNEAFQNIVHRSYFSQEGKQFALKVLRFMREKLSQIQHETGNLFNLEATPAEGASYRLARADLKLYPEIIHSGSKKRPYYTNSVHLPVNASDDIFEILDFEDELQQQFTGGTVIHIYLGEKVEDVLSVANLVRTIATNYKLPYFSITPVFSICPIHGYIPGEHFYCPKDHTPEELNQFGVEV